MGRPIRMMENEPMRTLKKRLKAPTASHDYTLKIVPTVYQDKSRNTKESVKTTSSGHFSRIT